MSLTDEIRNALRSATRFNRPHRNDGLREVGFVLPVEIAWPNDGSALDITQLIVDTMHSASPTHNDVERVARWSGQGGEAHKLMAVLACAARHECDDMEPDGPHEFIELDASVADTLNDLLGDLRDLQAIRGTDEGLVDQVIRNLAKQLYAHHVIKYDPQAEEYCIRQAVEALSNHQGNAR